MSYGKQQNSYKNQIALGVRVPQSEYGSTIPLLQGRTRIAPKIIFTGNFQTHKTGSKKQSKKGGSVTTYSANFDQILGYGPLTTLGSFWGNKSDFWPAVVKNSTLTLSGTGTDFSGVLPGGVSGGWWVTPAGDIAIQILAITYQNTIITSFNDYGGGGLVSVTDNGFEPLYNANATPLFVLGPGQGQNYCTYSRVSPLTQTFTVHIDGGATNPQVKVYYLVVPNSYTDISGNLVTNNVANWKKHGPPTFMQVEEQLGNGSEFSYAGGGGFQIIYPEFFGVGLENVDMGSSNTPPSYSYEGVAYHHYSPDGDCNPADHILALITSGNFWPYIPPSNSMWAHGLGFLPQNQSSNITTQVNILADPPVPWPGVRTGGGSVFSRGLEDLRAYCQAYGIFTSMYMDTQKSAADWIKDLSDVANFVVVWTGSQLKIIPRCEISAVGNGAIYNAPTASGPVYDLGDADFRQSGAQDPVIVDRNDRRAIPNIIPVQHNNRASGYYEKIVTPYKDQSQISLWGAQPDSMKDWSMIQDPQTALKCAAPVLKHKQMIEPVNYKFKLGVQHCLLDPYDLVTISDPNLFPSMVLPGQITNALNINVIGAGPISWILGGWDIDSKHGWIYFTAVRTTTGATEFGRAVLNADGTLSMTWIDPVARFGLSGGPGSVLADPIDSTVLLQAPVGGVNTIIKYKWDTDTVITTATGINLPSTQSSIQNPVKIATEEFFSGNIYSAKTLALVTSINYAGYTAATIYGLTRDAPSRHKAMLSYSGSFGIGHVTAIVDLNNQTPSGIHDLVDLGVSGNITNFPTGIQFSPDGTFGAASHGDFVDFFSISGFVPTLIQHVTVPTASQVVIDNNNVAYILVGTNRNQVDMYDCATGTYISTLGLFSSLGTNLNSGMGIMNHPTLGQWLFMLGNTGLQAMKLPVTVQAKVPVRLTSTKEDENYIIDCEAEPFIYGAHAPTQQTPEAANPTGGPPTTQPIATLVNTPFIFEPISALSGGLPQIWFAISDADVAYGGCAVYMSTDGGTTYELMGTVFGQSEQGLSITSIFPSHTDPDGTDTLHVDLAESFGTLVDFSTSQRDVFVPLCILEGGGTITVNGKTLTIPYELLSFDTSNFISGNQYDIIPTIRRGVYNTPIASHAIGSKFAFLGPGAVLFKMELPTSLIGTTLFFKFAAFNSFGTNQQDLTTCTAYSFTPTGLGQGSSASNSYTINPSPVLYQGQAGGYPLYPSFTDPTKLYIVPFTATWSDGTTANYTPTSPNVISGATPETLFVTIYDPGRTGSGTLFIDTTPTRSTQAGYVYLGSVFVANTGSGGGTGTGGGGGGSNPFDIAFYFKGTPSSSMELLRIPIDKTIVLPINLTGSQAVCKVAPGSGVSFPLTWIPVASGTPTSIGSINFAAGQTVATFTFPSAITLNQGDILVVAAPSVLNGLDTIGGMLAATR